MTLKTNLEKSSSIVKWDSSYAGYRVPTLIKIY